MRGDRALDLNLYTSDVNRKLPPNVGQSGNLHLYSRLRLLVTTQNDEE